MASEEGVAVVTGASSGIGLEIARELARRGVAVLAVARRLDRLRALAGEQHAAAIHPLGLDVTRDDAPETLRDKARELGGAGWLVNNAGFGLYGAFLSLDARRQRELVRLNCESMVAVTAAVLPDLVARRRGRVVNVASLAGFQPTPWFATYGASKAFVLSFTEGLSEELRGSGVTATALCPGPVATEFGDVAGLDDRQMEPPGRITAAECARFAIDAAERGVVVAVPGPLNRVAAAIGKVVPRSAVRRVAGRVMKPGQSGVPSIAARRKK